jgi:hypothetical protein
MNVIGRLVALGVGPQKTPGEALVWTRPGSRQHRTVAVDVGKYPEMGEQVAMAAPQILVLTHDDADHVDGWAGMARFGLGTLEQLWLPYEWGALVLALESLEPYPEVDAWAVTPQIHMLTSSATIVGSQERQTEGIAIDGAAAWRAYDRAKGLAERCNVDEVFTSRLGMFLKALDHQCRQGSTWRGTPDKVAERAMTRAAAITAIIAQALDAGVRPRYFSVDHAGLLSSTSPWEHSGIRGTVTIANATEVRFDRVGLTGLSGVGFVLYLTIQNSRALCPVLWGSDGRDPAVLVWSDSGGQWVHELKGVKELLRKISISTAPHHGSAAPDHDMAWDALDRSGTRDDLVIVLAGGASSQKSVHLKYLERCPVGRRGCTKCRHGRGRRRGPHSVVSLIRSDGLVELMLGGCRL